MKGEKKSRARDQRPAANLDTNRSSEANEYEATAENNAPNAQVLDLVYGFLSTHGYNKAVKDLVSNEKSSSQNWSGQSTNLPNLEQIFEQWQNGRGTNQGLAQAVQREEPEQAVDSSDDESSDAESSASESDSSDDESEDTSDESSDDSDGESDVSMEDGAALTTSALTEAVGAPTASNNVTAEAPTRSTKRKRSSSGSSSDSSSADDSSDSDSSDESESESEAESEEAPVAKKAKAAAASDSDDDFSSDSSSEDSDSDDSLLPADIALPDSDSSDSNSDSDSDDSVSNEDSAPTKAGVAIASTADESDDDSDSSSDADSDSSSADSEAASEKSAPTQPTTNEASSADEHKESSDSSVTLAHTSPDLHPVGGAAGKRKRSASPEQSSSGYTFKFPKKGPNTPFSRISKDQQVDPRFASNAYVPYDYADRAHQDLIVTKGKGFTKEKNKKKRGAYRGGMIDLTPKGIKFDD